MDDITEEVLRRASESIGDSFGYHREDYILISPVQLMALTVASAKTGVTKEVIWARAHVGWTMGTEPDPNEYEAVEIFLKNLRRPDAY